MFNYNDEEQDESMMGDEKSAKIKLLDQLIDHLQGMGDDSESDESQPDLSKDPKEDGDPEGLEIEVEANPDMKNKMKAML